MIYILKQETSKRGRVGGGEGVKLYAGKQITVQN